MKLGILSHTHNNIGNLQKALDLFEKQEVDTVIHCGDLTRVEVAFHLAGWAGQAGCKRVICAFGNGDIASGEMRSILLAQNPENYAGLVFTGEVDGVKIAAAHGHQPGVLEELVRSGQYSYVFKGHSHTHKEERIGPTRLINPGALGGMHREPRQVCVLDLESGKAKFEIVAV